MCAETTVKTRKPRKQAPEVKVPMYFQDERLMNIERAKAFLGDKADEVYFSYRHGYEPDVVTKSMGYEQVVIDGNPVQHKGDKLCMAPVAMRDMIRNHPGQLSDQQCRAAMNPQADAALAVRDSEGKTHGIIDPGRNGE